MCSCLEWKAWRVNEQLQGIGPFCRKEFCEHAFSIFRANHHVSIRYSRSGVWTVSVALRFDSWSFTLRKICPYRFDSLKQAAIAPISPLRSCLKRILFLFWSSHGNLMEFTISRFNNWNHVLICLSAPLLFDGKGYFSILDSSYIGVLVWCGNVTPSPWRDYCKSCYISGAWGEPVNRYRECT